MAPRPEERASTTEPMPTGGAADGDRVVISGMAGLYPRARYVSDLQRILYEKVNPISTDDLRWKVNHPEVAQYAGNVPELDRFDAQFFKVHYRLSNNMDPMSRKILEQTYEAIYDAGINPEQLSGKNVGVYIGTCFSETEKACFYDAANRTGFGVAGCSKSMFANRISYWLNAKGPSVSIDQACCSSTAALESAHKAILRGQCEAAVVGGAYLCLHPQSSVHYGRIMKVSKDGHTKSFDEHAAGCAKSEAINVLFLQKAKNAKRIYAEVVHVKCEFMSLTEGETGPEFGFYREPEVTAAFLKSFYEEAGVPPAAVEYVEAFGSAVPEADRSELEAIDRVFCAHREEPLPVGSVMSNIGYEEAASGISAITKVLLGYNTGMLAANLHCSTARRDVRALQEGRMRVLTEHANWRCTYAAVNSLSVTGGNAHVLLRGCYQRKDSNRYRCEIPHLVTLSNRQEEGVQRAIDILKSHPVDPEELALLHSIHETNISGHLGKGYVILDTNVEGKTISLGQSAEYSDGARRPLWFVYSGMGSQWAGMGAQLMRVPIFAAAIERCRRVLEPKGVDIVHIITTPDKSIFDNILHSFVGIAAVQIGLTDILRELGLVPDNIIGHSVGELGCAYADGCLTAEEMILAAYSRGRVSLETPFIRGAMAAVGLGAQQVASLCPPEIAVACHNSAESCTVSGPADAMRAFVADLSARGVFAKEVPCSNIAYHSRYIAEAGPGLLRYLQEVIPEPRERSPRWVSSSVPRERWHEPAAQYSSAEYHTNNLLSPVLFEEASALIPADAVLVEVAPHGLLQAILKRALPASCSNVPLTRRGHSDGVTMLLDAIGKLYLLGYFPRVGALYPRVQFPVSSGTPLLAHYVQWAHQECWPLPLYQSALRSVAASCKFLVCLHDREYAYLRGHALHGSVSVPFSMALSCVWDTLAMSSAVPRKALSVRFWDVRLLAMPVLHDKKIVHLSVAMQRGSGRFEVMEGESTVATGFVASIIKATERCDDSTTDTSLQHDDLSSQDVYQLLHERGYSYDGAFQSIVSADSSVSAGSVRWDGNWVTFLDGLLQLNLLKYSGGAGRGALPHRIGDLTIDLGQHGAAARGAELRALLSDVQGSTRSGGVTIRNISLREVARRASEQVTWQALPAAQKFSSPSDVEPAGAEGAVRLSGPLAALRWLPAPPPLGDGMLVTVHYSGLNVGDARRALGLSTQVEYDSCEGYGMDFSGVTERGERVMGVVRGAASSLVMARPELTWPVPAHWTLEDAATVPLAYLTAYYCLLLKTTMRIALKHVKQYSVLVHGGAGALGQAAISVALARGARVFTTVRDRSKKTFLKKLFPQLNEEDIGNSRDGSFSDMVLGATGGVGCNVVICCLKGELKHMSFKCVGPSSTIFDMTQIQCNDNYNLGMYNLTKERSYIAVDTRGFLDNYTSSDTAALHSLVSAGIASGEVRPLTRAVFPPREAARALRLLAASHYRGRALLRLTPHEPSAPSALPRFHWVANSCHVVVCETGSDGERLAETLVQCGVRRVHLHSWEPLGARLRYKTRAWQRAGAESTATSGALKSADEAHSLLAARGEVAAVYVLPATSLSATLPLLHRAAAAHCVGKFVVLSGTPASLEACVDSSEGAVPATCLDVTALEKASEATWRAALQHGVRLAWHGQHTALRAVLQRAASCSLLRDIAAIADIKIADEAESGATLAQLGLTAEKSEAVHSYLRDVHHFSVDEQRVPHLTVDRLAELEASERPAPAAAVRGLHVFFSHVVADELLATTELVRLPTLTHASGTRDDEFDAAQAALFVVPGLEGLHARFTELAQRLKLAAFVLQPGLDRPGASTREQADRYAQVLLKMGQKTPFYILGYEFGIDVALELAAILEEHGLAGTVFCLGGGPEELRAGLRRELAAFPDEVALQEAVAAHMFALMAGDGATRLPAVTGGWRERREAAVRALLGRAPHSAQYARALLDAALARLTAARAELPAPRALRSRLVVLRARESGAARGPCSLARYSQEPLVLHELESPLAHAARDLRVPTIINSHLHEDVLRAFDEKNLCDTYLMNADTFMTVNKN